MQEVNGIRIPDLSDLSRIPARKNDANKGDYGHVLLAAGSEGMCGAAYLSALSAYRTGAGLVRILTVESNRQILQTLLPEAIVTVYRPEQILMEREAWQEQLSELMDWSTAIIIGPGLGREPYVRALVEDVLQAAFVPLVADADALNTIAENPNLTRFYTENIILTPHPGEMARLTGRKIEELLSDPVFSAQEYRDSYGVTVCFKSHDTVTAAVDGAVYRTTSGTPALAKAGSGDVLTGIIAGLLCLGFNEGESTALGSFLHGLCGRKAVEGKSLHGLLAREIAEAIPFVMP